ncbi:DUF4192 family protein [Kitasatospora cineracea]|uniref:DUF4192 domain-containing protein n=1 Tax=Kitasatospora cineracea TaxID=88074 RepID=UPI0038056AB9
MTADDRTTTPAPRPGHLPVRLRGPADMAEMLPYLLGFFPDDSIVAVGLQGSGLDQGGVIRIDIPDDPAHWERTATEAARLLVELSEQRDRRPVQVLLYLCRDPDQGARVPEDGPAVLARLRPLADALARAFRGEQVAVKESLCVSAGHWWSFLCAGADCCPPGGTPVREARHPSPLAAAATYAGLAPRGSRKAIVAGLAPVGPPLSEVQRRALEDAGPPFVRELAGPGGRTAAVARTAGLIAEAMAEFQSGARELDAARTARLLIGMQDKLGRDRAAEYAEPDELGTAQRLWRFLVQRCVDPFEHLAAPPMTLLAWTSWLAGDPATARIVLARALELEPDYTLAQLLYESLNSGIAPESLLRVVRRERTARLRDAPAPRPVAPPPPAAADPGGTAPDGPGEGFGHREPDSGPLLPLPPTGTGPAPERPAPEPGPREKPAPEPDPRPAPAPEKAPDGRPGLAEADEPGDSHPSTPPAPADGPPTAACRPDPGRRPRPHRFVPTGIRIRQVRARRGRRTIGD